MAITGNDRFDFVIARELERCFWHVFDDIGPIASEVCLVGTLCSHQLESLQSKVKLSTLGSAIAQ